MAAHALTLADLGGSPHPTMEQGTFSIFNDPAVALASPAMTHYLDVDGVVLSSRYLEAFNVAPLGEARVVTIAANVTDKYSYVNKNQVFKLDSNNYDDDHAPLAKYVPGFALLDMPGGSSLSVVGVLNTRADVAEVERLKADPTQIRDSFMLRVFNRAILQLHHSSRTRLNNLALTIDMTGCLPEYYWIYQEDVPTLSRAIRLETKRLPNNTPYRFSFLYHKYGQQLVVSGPMTLRTVGLDQIVLRADKIDCAGIHLAVNFVAHDNGTALMWLLDRVKNGLRGRDMNQYPFVGLTEIGNTHCKDPRLRGLLECWEDRDDVHLTHAQGYTPIIKPWGTFRPFELHPFLLTYLMGRVYVARRKTLKRFHDATAKELDYSYLREAITLQLTCNKARFEVAATSRSLDAVLRVRLDRYARTIRNASFLVEVPKQDLMAYCNALIAELYAPLQASYQGHLDGDPRAISLLLMCETILAVVTGISTQNMPYQLLKVYGVAPLRSGRMAEEGRITLRHCARIGPTGLLELPRNTVDRVFLPQLAWNTVHGSGRREVFQALAFLGKLKANSRREIAPKAASALVDQFAEELVSTSVVSSRRVFNNAARLNSSGCSVHSVVSARNYASHAFSLVTVPRDSSLYGYLRVARDMTSEGELNACLERELLDKFSFLPRIVLHGSTHNVQATVFQALSPCSFEAVRDQVRMGDLMTERQMEPMLRACQVNLMRFLGLTARRALQVTRFSRDVAVLVSLIIRKMHAEDCC